VSHPGPRLPVDSAASAVPAVCPALIPDHQCLSCSQAPATISGISWMSCGLQGRAVRHLQAVSWCAGALWGGFISAGAGAAHRLRRTAQRQAFSCISSAVLGADTPLQRACVGGMWCTGGGEWRHIGLLGSATTLPNIIAPVAMSARRECVSGSGVLISMVLKKRCTPSGVVRALREPWLGGHFSTLGSWARDGVCSLMSTVLASAS
jgi:hypothetical protein